MDNIRPADDHPLAIGARAAAVACAFAIAIASLGPSGWLPRLLYSNNMEHFAAFYVVTLAFCGARYRTSVAWVLRDLIILATVLEAVKWVLPGPRPANFQHWIADLGGSLAAVAPMVVADFRRRFGAKASSGDES